MIRFVKNILDIKNILGMQRTPQPIPDPAYPAAQTVLRLSGTSLNMRPYYTGDLIVISSLGYHVHPVSDSGTMISLAGLNVGEDIKILSSGGTISSLDISSSTATFVAVGNTVGNLIMPNSVTTLDIRNADILVAVGYTPYNVDTFYAKADTSDVLSKAIINNSTVADGILWIDSTQTYAPSVITAAIAKGWTVYNL